MSNNFLVDIFELDLSKDNGDWTGNVESAETSACANFLNFQPYEFYFTPDGVDTVSFFTDDIYKNIVIPVEAYEQFLSNAIVKKGFSLAFIDSTVNTNSQLFVEIGLLNNEIITLDEGIV